MDSNAADKLILPSLRGALVLCFLVHYPHPRDTWLGRCYDPVLEVGGVDVYSHLVAEAQDNVILPEFSRATMKFFADSSDLVHRYYPPRCVATTEYTGGTCCAISTWLQHTTFRSNQSYFNSQALGMFRRYLLCLMYFFSHCTPLRPRLGLTQLT